jgi:hypothetical protein
MITKILEKEYYPVVASWLARQYICFKTEINVGPINSRAGLNRLYYCFFFFLLISLLSCGDGLLRSSISKSTIKFKGEDYEFLDYIPMAFNKDTIFPEIWNRTLNVDGDNKRIIRFLPESDMSIFTLPNAVNNHTDITFYSLEVNNNRYLWIEDNFGTTVIDIDRKKAVKVSESKKSLDEIAPSGAPIGVKNHINEIAMRRQLNINSNSKISILDSLTLSM